MMLLSRYKVSGHSMEPAIPAQSTLLASSVPYIFKEPKVGDVVVFKSLGKIFVKRIKKKEGQQYFRGSDFGFGFQEGLFVRGCP